MSIVIGNKTASNLNPSASTQTLAHNQNTGADKGLLVVVTMASTVDFTGCTYAGAPMTLVRNDDFTGESQRVAVYYLANPLNGANNIVVSFTGSQFNSTSIFAVSFVGAAGVDSHEGTAGVDTTNSQNLTIQANSVIYATGVSANAQNTQYSIGGSSRPFEFSHNTNRQVRGALSATGLIAGATNVTTSADFGNVTNVRVAIKEKLPLPTLNTTPATNITKISATSGGNTITNGGGTITSKGVCYTSQLWNPSFISTSLWLDASDSSTITESGGLVSQWNDKSGNNRHVTQPTQSNRPTKVLDSIVFNGVNNFLITPVLPRIYGLFLVIKPTNTITNLTPYQVVLSCIDFPAYIAFGEATGFFGNEIITIFDDVTTTSFSRQAVSVNNLPSIDNSSYHIQSFVDKTNWFVGQDGSYDLRDLSIGDREGLSSSGYYISILTNGFNGSIAEMILLDTAVSDTERQKIEGYLAHKWGVTANLPISHPYKNGQPFNAETCTNDGTGTTDFNSNLAGLSQNTNYHVRSYAENEGGTGYGDQVDFTTLKRRIIIT